MGILTRVIGRVRHHSTLILNFIAALLVKISQIFIRNSRKGIKFKKKVYVIGSGPSLKVDSLSKIRNSTVILLNSSYQLYDEFDKSNQIVIFIQDVKQVYSQIYKFLPRSVIKIIIVDRLYFNASLFKLVAQNLFSKKYRGKQIIHLVRQKFSLYSVLGLRSGVFYFKRRKNNIPTIARSHFGGFHPLALKINEYRKLNTDKRELYAWYSPNTVMVSAVFYAFESGAKYIYSYGFDMSNFMSNEIKYSSAIDPVYRFDGEKYAEKVYLSQAKSGRRKIFGDVGSEQPESYTQYKLLLSTNIWSRHVNKYLKKNGVHWKNCSNTSYVDLL